MDFVATFNRLYDRTQDLAVKFYKWLEIHDVTGMGILGFSVGVIGGVGAIGFRELLNFMQWLFYGVRESAVFISHVQSIPWYFRIAIPVSGGLLVGLIVYFFSEKVKGHGVPEVLESIVRKGGIMAGKIVPLKALASAVCIGSGGSAGREGPIVQIGSAFGSGLGSFLKLNETKVKTLIGCGASAGIAGTFNAPIGGIIFSLEILMEDFQISHYLPVVLSSVVSAALTQAYFGASPAFPIPEYTFISYWEFIFYAFLGLVTGVIALLYMNTLYTTETLFEKLKLPSYLKPAIGGALLGSLALLFPQVLGVGYHIIELTLANELSLVLLGSLVFAKIVATNLTLGSGGSGGIFAPSLLIGALIGSSFGQITNMLFPAITSNPTSYAVVGMGSLFAGVAHAPMTAIIILFEMTRDYRIILPLIYSCVVSVTITKWFQEENIYTMKLIRRGIQIREGKEIGVLESGTVSQAMKTDVISVNESATADKLHELFVNTHHTHYPVTSHENGEEVVGIINYTENWEILEENERGRWLIARDLAKEAPTIRENDSLNSALEKLTNFHVELLPVVNDQEQLVGVLSRNDIINTYNRLLRSKGDSNE